MTLYELALHPFIGYGFMRRALVACAALAVGGAPLGIFLVLRRMALVGDAMSHAILPGVSVAFLCFGLSLWPMTIGGLIAGLVVALSAGAITRFTGLKEDASFTGTYIVSLALGVLIISIHGNSVDLMHVLFGNVLAVNKDSLLMMSGIASLSVLTLATIYRSLIIECFDPGFMRSVHGRGALTHHIFLILLVLNLVSAFQALGTMMSLGILVLPAICTRFWTRNIDISIILCISFALLGSYIGLLLSYHASLPSGPAIVMVGGGMYLLSIFFGRYGSIAVKLKPRKHYAH